MQVSLSFAVGLDKGRQRVQGLVTGGEVARGVCVLCQDDGASGHQRINDGHCCRCRCRERDESNVNVELR